MVTATNVEATAVNTIGWLSSGSRSIVVPVYQRQYRWDIGACEQLLSDIRAVADLDDSRMHFLGSVLSSSGAEGQDLVLIDGQQRLTTLMLLAAALQHTVRGQVDDLAASLTRLLVSPSDPTRTRLRPHRAWAEKFEAVVFAQAENGLGSRFADNYSFFRSQISLGEAPRIWRGLQKLEHVAITLGPGANAQQIFESLNSTGEPLRDHELIHNYVLMGLSHAEQREIEEAFWLPLEENTGESIAAFWRHYLVQRTGREIAPGQRAVYDVFRQLFPRLDIHALREVAEEWRVYSELYRALLSPRTHADPALASRLAGLSTFGSALHPLLLRALYDHRRGATSDDELRDTLQLAETLSFRRAVVSVSMDRIVPRLCRARDEGHGALRESIARVTPSDERIRVALKFSPLPHPAFVLARLAGLDSAEGYDVDHIAPVVPGEAWTGGDGRVWAALSEDEQNSHRALSETLGNLALLEEERAATVFDAAFPAKRDAYAGSRVPQTREIAGIAVWSTAAVSRRSEHLADAVVRTWARPDLGPIDDDGLTPILDAVRRRGWPRGWQREWSYVEYRGEHWEVPDARYLFNRIFKRLWADARPAVVAFSERNGGPVYTEASWTGDWDALDDGHHLYMGWDYSYMLGAVQGVLDEAGIAPEVFVKYSYIGEAMQEIAGR
ncbi:DUF262 domain-containing protein [Microbacterium sp. NPDC077184]|uniref:DUF262 domain-containing protein n=1 Tax=Microbacterium sp. NPDC077184 TaxID=3154764 RepID=UPI00343607ED